MDLHIKKVWLAGAASCLLFFGFYWVLVWLPFDKTRFQFVALPYLVLPFAGALGAYLSRRLKGSVVERISSALFPVFAFVALFTVRIVYGLFFEGAPYTLPHFLGGFVCERDRQNVPRRHALLTDEIGYAIGDHASFARAGASQNQQGAIGG